MKIIVRSLVIALAVTGAIATSYAKPTSTVKVAKTSAYPVPPARLEPAAAVWEPGNKVVNS